MRNFDDQINSAFAELTQANLALAPQTEHGRNLVLRYRSVTSQLRLLIQAGCDVTITISPAAGPQGELRVEDWSEGRKR